MLGKVLRAKAQFIREMQSGAPLAILGPMEEYEVGPHSRSLGALRIILTFLPLAAPLDAIHLGADKIPQGSTNFCEKSNGL